MQPVRQSVRFIAPPPSRKMGASIRQRRGLWLMASGSCPISHEPSAISHDKARALLRGRARGPDDALLFLRDRRETFVDKPLNSTPLVGLRRVQVALRVG